MNSEIIKFLRSETGSSGLKICSYAFLSGIANALIIVIVTAAAQDFTQPNLKYLVLFLLCAAVYMITFKRGMSKATEEVRGIISKAHIRIADKIVRADLRSFEKIGPNYVYTVLSENAEIIFEAARLIVNCSSAALMILFSALYLIFISKTAFWISAVLILCSAAGFLHNQKRIEKELAAASRKENEFFGMLDHVLDGFVEVKMNQARGADLLENHLKKISLALRDIKIRTELKFLDNQLYAQSFWFLLIASISLLLPQISKTPPGTITSVTMIVLFNLGPVATIVASIPIIVKANFAVQKLSDLETRLDASEDSESAGPGAPFEPGQSFRSLELRNLRFTYDENSSGGFSIGPIDLTINANETVFIVGGNGSGKTTLLKNLAGLYYPEEGAVLYNGAAVTRGNYGRYRNTLSLILADFHLFDRLYGLADIDLDRLNALLREMGIEDKTSYSDNRFSTIHLSTGQRKRLAMISALMEDREILIFDELAADQAPEFRKYFYEDLLKRLKSEGKTVICTSHDDRYFHLADRIIKMEYGKIVGIDDQTALKQVS